MNRLAGKCGRLRENGIEIERAGHYENGKNAEGEAEIADAIDDEGLDRGRIRLRLMVPEPNEQVAH